MEEVFQMPIVNVRLFEGRTIDEKRKLASEVTKTICGTLSVPPESVRIIIEDMPRENFSVAGVLAVDKK